MIFDKKRVETVCYQTILNSWQMSADTFPDFLTPISREERQKNEQFLTHQMKHLQKLLKSYKNPFVIKRFWKKKFNALINTLLFQEPIIGIADTFSTEILNDMQREFRLFFDAASAFDEKMDMDEIGQAARNYLVYDVFTEIHEQPHSMTPAIFGYSMLYPYTDNYIDNPGLSEKEKETYNQMIADRILGKEIMTENAYWKKTCELLDDVTQFYEKEDKTDIQQGLLFMLEAQKKSLSQTKKENTILLTQDEIFRISSYKGGISVLLDRFYVSSSMTQEDFVFYLSYGFFLQLADDLQDITEDRHTMRQTLFTTDSMLNFDESVCKKHNETILNRVFHYLHNIMEAYSMHNTALKNFIEKNCHLLLMYSALLSGENFNTSYLEQFTSYLPVSLPFLQHLKEALSPYMADLDFKKIIADGINISDIQSQNR